MECRCCLIAIKFHNANRGVGSLQNDLNRDLSRGEGDPDAECLEPRHDIAPGTLQSLKIRALSKVQDVLCRVRHRVAHGMEEHALLHWRQRKNRLDGGCRAAVEHAVQRLLVDQASGVKVGWGKRVADVRLETSSAGQGIDDV